MVTVSEQYKLEQENKRLKQKLEKKKEWVWKDYTKTGYDNEDIIKTFKKILNSQEKE